MNADVSGRFVSGGWCVRTQIVPIQNVCSTQPQIIKISPACCSRSSRANSDASATRVPQAYSASAR